MILKKGKAVAKKRRENVLRKSRSKRKTTLGKKM